jgi:1-acyl-sn-glycerol-3-phosphate acyltransferase
MLLILQILLIAIFTVPLALIIIVARPLSRKGRVFHFIAQVWSRMVLFICGVKVKVHGLKNIRRPGHYIYVSNHVSAFDIPAVVVGIPDRIRIVFKKELQKIPFFGWALKFGDYIKIDRGKRVSAMRSLEKAASKMREGASVLLFAEGTRSKDGKLQPFKRGAFTLASKSGVPIVPVTINGSSRILPKNTLKLRPGTIHLVLDEPIPTEGYNTKEGELQLMEKVRNAVAKNFAG